MLPSHPNPPTPPHTSPPLQEWLAEDDEERDHPGARQRRPYIAKTGKRKAMMEGEGDWGGGGVGV